MRGSAIIFWVVVLLGAGRSGRAATAPYPPSPAVQRLDWHETVDLGTDNDNWPTTWADDDRVYTAGGDGFGFGGERGNWICRLTGDAPSLTGENVARISTGSGPTGIKGSGILCISGTLYLWVRNVDGNGHYGRLGWSTDHGQSWTWGPTFTPLGYPTFVNFGRDYAGARDSYVYTVSHDDSSAYVSSDRFILLRAPVGHLTDSGAYEYFVGKDGSGAPIWSSDPAQRGAVFTHSGAGVGRCERSGISYDAGLGRYLWWQTYPPDGGGPPTGFGIYDAPEPWGPWTTVYFNTAWDQDPGECGGFCTKYMSADGNTIWAVFSGGDHLRLRRATLTSAITPPRRSALELRAFPNPFTSSTHAAFRVPGPSAVRIDVRDVHGQRVTTLLDGPLEGGAQSVDWDGQDERGRRVAAGVYVLRLDVAGVVESVRVTLLR